MLRSAGRLYELGANINWGAFYANFTRRRVTLPTYPYQRKRYWIDETNMAISAQPVSLNPNPSPASGNAASRGPQRLAELKRAESLLNDDAPFIPVYFYQSRHLVRPYVQGWQGNVMDRHLSQYLSVQAGQGG